MLRIETLNKEHHRSDFDCGVPELNRYLKNIAIQHLNKGISRTFVLIDDAVPTEIVGFFTLAFCELFVEKLPREYAKRYPHKAPAAKLARLAVAKERQRRGLGMHMLVNAIERVINVSNNLGIIGFFVDTKNNDAKAYYEQFGFIPLPDRPLELFLPLATLRKACDTVSEHL